MSPQERSEKFQIRLTPEERDMLARLSDDRGLSASDVVRQLVRAAYAETITPNPRPAVLRAKKAPAKPKR